MILQERRYQRLKWGVRQPDGELVEPRSSDGPARSWVLIADRVNRAAASYARLADPSELEVRKHLAVIPALAWAALENNWTLPGDLSAFLDTNSSEDPASTPAKLLWAYWRHLHELSVNPDYSRFTRCVTLAVPSFMAFGVTMREIPHDLVNMRDGKHVFPQHEAT